VIAATLQVVLVMGVAGCGKTTIGELLAERLGGCFFDADDFHSIANVEKMTRGESLTDVDRWPWLDAVAEAVQSHEEPCVLVLGCSALKATYRNRLRLPHHKIVLLTAPLKTLQERLVSRGGHFMPSQLLDSQLDILEEPEDAIKVSVIGSPTDIVNHIVQALD